MPDLSTAAAGLRLAAGLLTAVPVGVPRVDRAVAAWAMTLAPLPGLALGGAGALTYWAAAQATGPLLAAVLALGVLALLTRGLHLDGLADLADGLGSGRPAEQALAVMKRSDIGPFGVVAVLFTVLIQVTALAEAGAAALVVAAVTGRLAVTWACRTGVPSARPEGLGGLVAGSVGPVRAAGATAAVLAGALIIGPAGPAAVLTGLAAAWGLRAHAVRRLGGITGDVLGALVETATGASLVICAAFP